MVQMRRRRGGSLFLFFSSNGPEKGSRFALRTHDERSSKPHSLGQAVLFTNLYQPIALNLSQGLRWIGGFSGCIIKVSHDLDGRLIADGPQRHEQMVGARLQETTAQAQDALAGPGLA